MGVASMCYVRVRVAWTLERRVMLTTAVFHVQYSHDFSISIFHFFWTDDTVHVIHAYLWSDITCRCDIIDTNTNDGTAHLQAAVDYTRMITCILV